MTEGKTGVEWVYATWNNIAEVARETRLSEAEVIDRIMYQEEQGNHYAPIPIPRPPVR